MGENKTEILRLRVTPELKKKFIAACEAAEETPSRVLHDYVKAFVKAGGRKMKKFMVIEQIVGEMNRWFFQAKGEAEKKLAEIISENERQGRRRVSLCEWAAAEIEMQARQHKMFLADMEEITPDMPEWDEGDGE